MKLLLRASEVRSAVGSFNAGMGVKGEVYFFDTPSLDLLLQGIILRVRRGAASDLTLKVRSPTDNRYRGNANRNARFKCELDWTGATVVRSYSVQAQLNSVVPESGEQVFELLSSAQKKLLEQVHTSIDWSHVKRIVEIKSTAWKIRNQPPFGQLMLELWEWPTGSVVELSTKVAADAAETAYAELQRMAASRKLSPSKKQTSKTALVLSEITHVTVH